jgi:hypothetical protein
LVYQRGLDSFIKFRENLLKKNECPISITDFSYYLAYMSKQGFAYSTVRSYVAGISFFCKLNNVEDVAKIVILKMLECFKRSSPSKEIRLPITRLLLANILKIILAFCHSVYEAKLFCAAFTTTFHGNFLVDEITKDTRGKAEHFIRFQDIKMFSDRVEVCVPSSKTDQFGRGATVVIPSEPDCHVCPVIRLREYLLIRTGQLICHFDGTYVSRYQFSALLNTLLAYLHVPAQGSKNHSFRIGMVTALSEVRKEDRMKKLNA